MMPERGWKVGIRSEEPLSQWDDVQTALLKRREVEAHSAEKFFHPVYERDIHDPFLLYGMADAVARISRAVEKKERILIYGDYDVDGISSTALLMSVLEKAGALVTPYIPHRYGEGYGLQLTALEQLAPECDLVITVDCGISGLAEVAWLKERKKDVIIIDHHSFAENNQLPVADVIIHPRHPAGSYPFGQLAAAGVTWKVCQALLRSGLIPGATHDDEKWLLDLACLGTLSDMVPLLDENRFIVQWGLYVLQHTKRPGLQALLQHARLDAATLDAKAVSWRLIPQLNAAGKMDHAQPALDVLMATSQAQAQHAIAEITRLNSLRQSQTTRVMKEAEKLIDPSAPFLFASGDNWPAGVVGLVAGRLAEKFSRPAIVVGTNGRHAVGSARSPKASNVLDLLRQGEAHFLKFGGHARAAGFSLLTDSIPDLHTTLQKQVFLAPAQESLSYEAEAIVSDALLTMQTLDHLEAFAPYGEGNPQPYFIARRLALLETKPVGKTKEHLKMKFMVNDQAVDGIGFGLASAFPEPVPLVDVLFTLTANHFGGRKRMQLEVKDMAPTGTVAITYHE